VHLLDPVPYGKVQGAGLYTQFVDRREWATFMRNGYDHAWAMLDRLPARAEGSASPDLGEASSRRLT
jgi:hypothetical protein